MSRKRFLKLVMSRGYDRNMANLIAQSVRESGKPYFQAYSEMPDLEYRINCTWKAARVVFEKLQKTLIAFSEAYRNATEMRNQNG